MGGGLPVPPALPQTKALTYTSVTHLLSQGKQSWESLLFFYFKNVVLWHNPAFLALVALPVPPALPCSSDAVSSMFVFHQDLLLLFLF